MRVLRHLSQDFVSDYLGLTGDSKRRSMTRYEKGDRNPKDERTKEIAEILNVDVNAIKKYDYRNQIDLIYLFLLFEELIPNYNLDLSKVPRINDNNILFLKSFFDEWNIIREKRTNREISYNDYLEWKLNYKIGECCEYERNN